MQRALFVFFGVRGGLESVANLVATEESSLRMPFVLWNAVLVAAWTQREVTVQSLPAELDL